MKKLAVLFFIGILVVPLRLHAKEKQFTCVPNGDKLDCYRVENSIPTIKSGFLVDLCKESRDGFFYLGLEAFKTKINTYDLSIDFGIASSRVMIGVGSGLLYDNKVGPFLWVGYNIATNAPSYGIGLTVLRI